MKKGFTLIELLAVIIILAVIALIATPMVLNVVEDARAEAAAQSVNGYISAVQNARYEYLFKKDMVEPETLSDITGAGIAITVKGDTVTCTGTTFTNGVYNATSCSVGDYTCPVGTNGVAGECTK